MSENKRNYHEYAQRKIGNPPRLVLQNYRNRIFNEIIERHCMKNQKIIVVEFGFNHGNDSRYILKYLLESAMNVEWEFYAFDNEEFFMENNLYYGLTLEQIEELKKHKYTVPCRFENYLAETTKFPFPYISFFIRQCR